MQSVASCPGIENILLIVADQWRGDHLETASHPALDLPNLRELSAGGTTFAKHYVQCVPCGPARTSLHTGLYLMTHRAVRNSTPLNRDFTNLAKEVRKASYDPALVGYTTTTPDPRDTHPMDPRFFVLGDIMEGWREITSFAPSKAPYQGHLRKHGYDVPLDREPTYWRPRSGEYGPSAEPTAIDADLSDTVWLTNCGLDYLRGRLGDSWFLHLGLYRPHPPFIAPPGYHDLYDPAALPKAIRAASVEEEGAQHPLLKFYLDTVPNEKFFEAAEGLGANLSDERIGLMRAAYCGMIKEIDDQLGRIFAYLKETGQWNKTLIIFTSDHGEQLGDHHLLGKLGYFDESYHIPMIVRDPRPEADAGRGRLVSHFTEQVDVMPTILEWIGLDAPRQCDGRSLLPFCRGETPTDWRRHAHYEFDFRDCITEEPQRTLGLHMDDCGLCVIQDERFKYIHFTSLPPLLFDLEKDPGQLQNVAGDPGYAGIMLEYAQEMLSWRMRHADKRLTGFTASTDGLIERRP
ncbi:MAG TPA: alkaline phosphatase family protein [Alphaproteobacteria bacterium]|nr:alkaline phosphatase family protein [Alphaproteobacteria bacterium]